jgi:hypothetical protein
MAPKKRHENKFFPPLSFIAVFGSGGIQDLGSGMGKNQDLGSGINIPDPQHCKKFVSKLSKIWVWDPGSGKNLSRIRVLGS